jgi:ABC-type molybdate transport system substrate-binding protein
LSPIVAAIQGEAGRHLIVYPVALVVAPANRDTAFFLAYLASQAATRKFLELGFDILPK